MEERQSFGRRIFVAVACGEFFFMGMAVVFSPTVPAVVYSVLFSLIPLLVTAVIAGRFVYSPDNETRCRKCGYILRGISELRCSECGEVI